MSLELDRSGRRPTSDVELKWNFVLQNQRISLRTFVPNSTLTVASAVNLVHSFIHLYQKLRSIDVHIIGLHIKKEHMHTDIQKQIYV